MQQFSPFALAHYLLDVADELAYRIDRGPCNLQKTLVCAVYLDDLVRGVRGQSIYKERLTYTHMRTYAALRRTLVGESGYFGFAQATRAILDDDVCTAITWFGVELSFLAQRGYKCDLEEIVRFRQFFIAAVPRIADTPAIATRIREMG